MAISAIMVAASLAVDALSVLAVDELDAVVAELSVADVALAVDAVVVLSVLAVELEPVIICSTSASISFHRELISSALELDVLSEVEDVVELAVLALDPRSLTNC